MYLLLLLWRIFIHPQLGCDDHEEDALKDS